MAKLTKNPLKNKIVGRYLAPGEQGANWPARPLAPAVVAGADAFFPFVSGVLGPAGADVLDPDGAAFPDVAGPVDAVFPDVVDPGGVVLAAAFDGAAGPLGVVLAVALLDVVEPHGAVVHAAYLDDAALAGAADQECAADQKCAALVVGPDSVGPSVLDQDALHRGVWHQGTWHRGTWHRGVWGRAVFVRAVPVLYGAVRDGLFPAPTACAGLLPASSVPFPFFPRPGVHAPAANVRFAQPVVRAPAYAPVHGYSDPTALACKRHNRCNSGRYDNKASENKDLECNPTLKPVLPTKTRQL